MLDRLDFWQYWTWLHHFFIWGELVVWFSFLVVFGALPTNLSGELHWLFVKIVANSSSFYRIVLLTTVFALLPSFAIHCFSRFLFSIKNLLNMQL